MFSIIWLVSNCSGCFLKFLAQCKNHPWYEKSDSPENFLKTFFMAAEAVMSCQKKTRSHKTWSCLFSGCGRFQWHKITVLDNFSGQKDWIDCVCRMLSRAWKKCVSKTLSFLCHELRTTDSIQLKTKLDWFRCIPEFPRLGESQKSKMHFCRLGKRFGEKTLGQCARTGVKVKSNLLFLERRKNTPCHKFSSC